MLKYLAVIAVLSFAVNPLSSQHQAAAAKHTGKPGNGAPPAVTVNNNSYTASDQKKANQNRHWWYKFVAWPEGITATALIATLIAIGWQAAETHRYTSISQKQFVSIFRPKVIVRAVNVKNVTPQDSQTPEWHIEILVVNVGGTEAHLDPWNMKFEWSMKSGNEIINEQVVERRKLIAGESWPLDFKILDQTRFAICMQMLDDAVVKDGRSQYAYPVCSGTLVYADANKCKRRTGFYRFWVTKEARFAAATDPEYEYQD